MPFDLLSKVGLPTGILIVMAFLIWEWIKSNKQIHEDHKTFVNEVICKCDKRENELMNHIEKQDESMDRITNTLEKMDTRLSNIEYQVKGR
jgi:hypothetical protein